MTYVIALPGVDVKDRACDEECPVKAIYYEDDLPDKWALHTADNARFFTDVLPGRDSPLGSPGGAGKLGALPADPPLVAGLRPHPMEGRNHV